jgi:hypothetical protein
MSLEPAKAAFYAAIVAALASIATLISTVWSAYRADLRKARRDAIASNLPDLFEGLYATVARTKQAVDAKEPTTAAKKWELALAVTRDLEQARLKSRLFLGDISSAVHQLILTPRIARMCASNPARIKHVIPLATSLRQAIDAALRAAYVEGRFPSPKEVRVVSEVAEKFANFFSESREWDTSDEGDG